jgi:hypothetical protein
MVRPFYHNLRKPKVVFYDKYHAVSGLVIGAIVTGFVNQLTDNIQVFRLC